MRKSREHRPFSIDPYLFFKIWLFCHQLHSKKQTFSQCSLEIKQWALMKVSPCKIGCLKSMSKIIQDLQFQFSLSKGIGVIPLSRHAMANEKPCSLQHPATPGAELVLFKLGLGSSESRKQNKPSVRLSHFRGP